MFLIAKSPLRWIGGKTKLSNDIIAIMPIHKCYVEVFGGGLSILFNKPKTKPEIINDINSELINFWRVVQNNFEEFKNKSKYLLPSREIFEDYKHADISTLNEIERAVRFFYINRTCFGGDMNHPRFGSSNSRRSNLCCITDDFDAFMKPIYGRLKDVFIENTDYKILIPKYDEKNTAIEKQNVLFYIDPPYVEEYGYEYGFNIDDHMELSHIIKNIRGKFILSINNHPLVHEIYKDFYFIDKELKCTLSKGSQSTKDRKELIITNYDTETITRIS